MGEMGHHTDEKELLAIPFSNMPTVSTTEENG